MAQSGREAGTSPNTEAALAAAPTFTHLPLQGRISSAYGERRDPFTGNMAMHAGIDMVAAEGTPVVAPADGRVLRVVADHSGYGNMLEVDHGGGYVTRYGQLSAFEVREGDVVRAGQMIARVGSSGPPPARTCTLKSGAMTAHGTPRCF